MQVLELSVVNIRMGQSKTVLGKPTVVTLDKLKVNTGFQE